MVSGEFGFAEAWQAKKESLVDWLTDIRPAIKVFAERHIAELDLMIEFERRAAERRREMRNRSYEEDDDKSDDDDSST